jgi:hypothetical protein
MIIVLVILALVVAIAGLRGPAISANRPVMVARNGEWRVTFRVVVRDGQSVGLAGLIRDKRSKSNGGVLWCRNFRLWASSFRTRTTGLPEPGYRCGSPCM